MMDMHLSDVDKIVPIAPFTSPHLVSMLRLGITRAPTATLTTGRGRKSIEPIQALRELYAGTLAV